MITEVYVSLDNIEFTKLDLYKDEAINLKKTQKDLQDLSKVFSPYSLNFSFKATPKNRQAFGFFGDTKVIKINPENKYFCKVYINSALILKGFMTLKSLNFKNNTAENFIGSFETSLTDLKTRIGEGLINDLATLQIDYTPKRVYDLLRGQDNTIVDGINVSYFIPLISNNRVMSYDITNTLLDNVKWNNSYDANHINLIKSNELRPCISFSSVMEFIIKKEGLKVNCPLFLRPEYKDLMIFANNENIVTNLEKRLTIKSPFGGYGWSSAPTLQSPYTPTANIVDSTFKIRYSLPATPSGFTVYYQPFASFSVNLQNVTFTSSSAAAPNVIIRLKKVGTNEVFKVKSFGLTGSAFVGVINIENTFFTAGVLDFYVTAEFNTPCIWTNCEYQVANFFSGRFDFGTSSVVFDNVKVARESNPNNNSQEFGATSINLFKLLPNIKVVDFLTSFFKTFNISVFEDSITNENLNWLTPEDINTTGLTYSKARLDYTPYTDITEVTKSTGIDYNFFDLKHAVSKYKSNTDYKEAFTVEYGEVIYPAIKPDKLVPFTVQTSFSIIPPVLLIGSDIPTFYGFTKDAPTILGGGQSRYKPNYNECTLFYNHGIKPLGIILGAQSQNMANVLINTRLNTYNKVMPFSKFNHSLAFSNIVFNSIEYADSLFIKYYAEQIIRLLDPNVLSQTFTLHLPSSELYLNEATIIQGGGQTPAGFRLQNEIIIGEYLFTIIDANIDITTGKTKLTLLNF